MFLFKIKFSSNVISRTHQNLSFYFHFLFLFLLKYRKFNISSFHGGVQIVRFESLFFYLHTFYPLYMNIQQIFPKRPKFQDAIHIKLCAYFRSFILFCSLRFEVLYVIRNICYYFFL